MIRQRTLRLQFATWTAGLLFAALVVFGTAMYVSLDRSLRAAVDDSLRLSAAQAIAAVNVENGQLAIVDSVPEGAIADLSDRGLTIRVIDPNGRVLQAAGSYRDAPTDASSITAAQQGQSSFSTREMERDSDGVRFYVAPIEEHGRFLGIVEVGQSLDLVNDTVQRLLIFLVISIPMLVGLAAVGGYVLAAKALAPIDRITQTARIISATDLHARLALPVTNDEVGRLAVTFDAMLERLDDAFQRERRFTADASHELRTPLTAIQTILSVMREQRRTPEEYELALDDVGIQTERLRGLIEALLRLARDERPTPRLMEHVDLSTMLRDVADSLAPLAEAKGLMLRALIQDNLWVSGDSDDLVRVFVNVIDNAIKYTNDGTISLRAASIDTCIAVHISDTGIGIAEEHLPHIFERFYRVDAARSSQGTGLGLAIAQEIIAGHKGTISVTSIVSSGTTVTVQFSTEHQS